MNMWEAIVVIVVVTSFARVFRARYGVPDRRSQSLINFPQDDSARREAAELRRELAEVSERVKVLERIITDNRHADSVAAEIEALRDR